MAKRVAVLVDGDNLSPRHADTLLTEAKRLGRIDVARVYADAARPSGWLQLPGWRVFHAGAGKNAADCLMCIDGMELSLAAGIEAFVLASSDGDFGHLAQRLRERGHSVRGIGEEKAPARFREACTGFTVLGPEVPPLDRAVREVLASGPVRVTDLNLLVFHAHGLKIGDSPEGNWRAWLTARPEVFAADPRGPGAKVRLRG